MDNDIVRVIHDLKTFTAIDLANALDVPEGTAGARLSDWVKSGHVVRVKIGRTFLYAIGPKAARIHAKLPELDPDELCLPLWLPPTPERYLYHRGTPVLDTSEDEVFGYD